MMSQNALLAIDLAFLLSADVPGVNVPLSPRVEGCGLLLGGLDRVRGSCRSTRPPTRRTSPTRRSARCRRPRRSAPPRAAAAGAASAPGRAPTACAPVDFFEMSLQKPPISLPRVSMWPRRRASCRRCRPCRDAREGVPEGGPAEPGDVGERRVRRPEALGAGHALAGVLEHAGHRVAVLQVDGGGLACSGRRRRCCRRCR